MSRKKICTTVYITYEQDKSLKSLHDRTQVAVAAYIREGIDMVLEKYKEQIPGQLELPFLFGDEKATDRKNETED